MQKKQHCVPLGQNRSVSRRDAMMAGLAATGIAATASTNAQASEGESRQSAGGSGKDDRKSSPKLYRAKKSINQWAFPYPDRMSLRECMQLAKDAGFDGIELNYDLDNDLSPKASKQDLLGIRRMADDIGIAISGLCSFLFWPLPAFQPRQ